LVFPSGPKERPPATPRTTKLSDDLKEIIPIQVDAGWSWAVAHRLGRPTATWLRHDGLAAAPCFKRLSDARRY